MSFHFGRAALCATLAFAPFVPRAAGADRLILARCKAGGRTNDGWSGKLAKPGAYPIESGAGGGLGRLEKAERAARG